MVQYTSMQSPKDPLDKLTKLEKIKEIKRQAGEDAEKLEAMGQESEHRAKKWVQEVGKQEREKEKKRVDDVMERLFDSRKFVLTYKGLLIEEMRKEMGYWSEDLPRGFQWRVQSTEKGIVLWIRTPQGSYLAKGIKLSGEPEIDLNAIARLIVNGVQEMTKYEEKTPNGIIVPT